MDTNISELEHAGQEVEIIPVSINYDIIRLFSEGLYRSPHKAIEELVSNGYDAGAKQVHVLLPEQSEDETETLAPLWVIDDGHGMDASGFFQLWRIAESNKVDLQTINGRAPIGQFGIGKLAAYVLAWRLTHLSRVDEKLLLTSMDFHKVKGRQAEGAGQVEISLREVDESTAKAYLAEIELRDPAAWKLMFGEENRKSTWTAAGLSDFKDLYNQLAIGTLRWVLSTGLPLHTNFKIWLNGERVKSSKENLQEIKVFSLGSEEDTAAKEISLTINHQGNVELPGIGAVSGTARIYEKQLTGGKSTYFGRSNGFFIRVRRRVINLEDELFGLEALNHAAWSRFALEVNADGLREYLLSSREGVRDSENIREFRNYLKMIFNLCRNAYEAYERKKNEGLDIEKLLSDEPSTHVIDPLLLSVRDVVETGSDSFYISVPPRVTEEERSELLAEYEREISERPIDNTTFEEQGPNAPAICFDPDTRSLVVNLDHPFVDKLSIDSARRNAAKLFASSEVLIEGQLREQGINSSAIGNFMRDRDRTMRVMAGDAPPTATEVLRRLKVAGQDHVALERAVGAVFQLVGFKYERKGGNAPGPDGLLYARLGHHKDMSADYRLVYDAKQTNQPSVPAAKIDLSSLENFRKRAEADFGFFIAIGYAGETKPESTVNQKMEQEAGRYLTLLKVEHLRRLVWLHYQHGVTLTELRNLFDKARTVPHVDSELELLEQSLEQKEVPLAFLLQYLEQEKLDLMATPNVIAVRAKHQELQKFNPKRLTARLKAVENIIGTRWIEVETEGEVIMHQTAKEILTEFERNMGNLIDNDSEEHEG